MNADCGCALIRCCNVNWTIEPLENSLILEPSVYGKQHSPFVSVFACPISAWNLSAKSTWFGKTKQPHTWPCYRLTHNVLSLWSHFFAQYRWQQHQLLINFLYSGFCKKNATDITVNTDSNARILLRFRYAYSLLSISDISVLLISFIDDNDGI